MEKVLSSRVRFWTWFNIIVQVIIPLSVAFTPLIADAGEQRLLTAPAQVTQPGAIPEAANDELAQKIAGHAVQTGSFLASRPNGDAALSTARGLATGAASGEIQQWLSQFGTARVQLDADQHFSLKNSQFELLLPLYDRGDNLVFTQGSLHRTDGRAQASLGVGTRHFTPTWMLGGNLFGDYDISRGHSRIGVGVEYWRDFITLGANGYLQLSGWKASPDLIDYEERPANGWDLRAQAWLPVLPQLGGNLDFGGKTLISPMTLTFYVQGKNNENVDVLTGALSTLNSLTAGKEFRGGYRDISEKCWRNHWGSYSVYVRAHYNGKSYNYGSEPFDWTGQGIGFAKDNFSSTWVKD